MSAQDKLLAYSEGKIERRRPSRTEVWTPPTREMLPPYANLIAVDQSLAACGLVHLMCVGGELEVLAATRLTGHSDATGNEGNLQKADDLYCQLVDLLGWWAAVGAEVPKLAHEATPPAKPGSQLSRPDSSLLSAAALRHARHAHGMELVAVIEPRTHGKLMTGNANTKKPERRAALPGVAEGLGIAGMEKITNEAHRDALSVGICALIQHSGRF